SVAVCKRGLDPHDLGIEIANAFCAPLRHVEFDMGNAERDPPEAGGIRLVAAHAIAPRTDRLDMVIVRAECEGGAVELWAHRGEALEQRRAVRHHDGG